MQREIPQDPTEYNKLVQQLSLRMQASSDFYVGYREEWDECYRRWHTLPERPDRISESDDYEIKLSYAFGLVEQLNSKVTEPMLQMGVPFGIYPKDLGDQIKADNFAEICRDFYAKPNVQDGKRRSKKEMIITGNRFEVDEWLHVVVPGKAWGKVPQVVEQPIINPQTGQPVQDKDGKPVMAKIEVLVDAEVDKKITTHYGFNTRYPRVFDIYPEPDRTTIDTGQRTDVSWIVEDLGELALEDMMREVIYDPKTKKTVPRYDFTKLIHDAGEAAQKRYEHMLEGGNIVEDGRGPIISPIHDWADAYGRRDATNRRHNDAVSTLSFEDRDKVWVAQMRTNTEIRTVVQGKYIIERVTDPWHHPQLGVRVENYTTDPRCLYGPGAIKPILAELIELDITHSLGMQNFFRIVNKMIAVKEKAVMSMAEFDPRAGGIIRINEECSPAEAVHPIEQSNVVADVLGTESQIKGNLEFSSSNLDGSPGTHGTKQQHKTKGGMEIIAANLGTRFATMQSQALINEARCAQSMLYFFEQFCWEKVPYRILREDGTTVYAKFTKDDVGTDGRGFDFVITVDPLWGNTQAQRQDALAIFQEAMGYEKFRAESKDPKMKKADLSVLFEDLLRKSGRRDMSRIFVNPSGEIDPGAELQIIMNGGIVECQGDLQHHVITHLLQLQSQNLIKAVEAEKAHPDTLKRLRLLIEQDMAKIKTFIVNPMGAAQERLNQAGMTHPGPGDSA